MRDLKKNEKNVLAINDARSGSEIELYYRNPTTQEEVAFNNSFVKRKGNKMVLNAYATRLEFGLKIMTGFREGDFGYEGKPISSEPASANYREDWKEIVKDGAHDIVVTLARAVFEGTKAKAVVEDVELEEENLEEISPLPKS